VDADLILTGGRILTLDGASRIAEALAVRGDRIAAVGAAADVGALVGPATRVIDLRGRAVVPGLIDAHAHLDREGLKSVFPSLAGARSIDDVLQRIAALVERTPPGEWIVTMPLGDPPYYLDVPDNLRERRFPTRLDLDRVAPRHPVYIRAIWGYWRHTLPLVSIANSEALRRAGITRDSPAPWEGVTIERDAAGEPTGVFLEETYVPLVELTLMAAAPRFTHAQRVQGLRDSLRAYHAHGTTGVFEGHGVAPEVVGAYRALGAEGALTMRARLVVSPSWGQPPSLGAPFGPWSVGEAAQGLGDGWLGIGGLHAEVGPSPDNVVRARALPYTGWAGFAYDAGLPREALVEVLVAAAREGIRVVGITREALPVFAEVDRRVPLAGRRWVLGHISTLDAGEIRTIRDLGLVVTTHTNRYLYKEADAFARRLGPEAEDTLVPLRRLREAGVHVALATDNVPVSLFYPLWQAVARADRATGRVVAPAQRLTREEALRACTVEGAYLTFEEETRGRLEPGKWADLAVLSADPLTCPEDELKDITADLTITGGRIVWERATR
jgi:hypothetical protein